MEDTITLRDVKPEDKDMLRAWRNSPHVAVFMYNDHHISPEEHDRWFRSTLQNPSRRYWITTLGGHDFGLANLYDIDERNRRCYWAFYIGDAAYQGKGLGCFVEYTVLDYVFGTLKLNKLCSEVLASNQPVLDLHKHFGFTQEGYYREHVWKGGKFVDVVFLAMFWREWQQQRPRLRAELGKIAGVIQRKGQAPGAATEDRK